ncbi:hypothetical protein Tco_1085882, partial [Tanacetum coccineum]
ICLEIDDTWAWVASGSKRQPDAAVGALEAAEDVPVADEGAPAVPAPVLSQMMSQTRVSFTSYADFQILYERRTRRRTDGASTFGAPQQPDP